MKWGKGKADRIEPDAYRKNGPVGDEVDEEQLDLELAELRHRKRQKQLPDQGNQFHAPGPVDLDYNELQETPGRHRRGVIDLHPHEVEEHDTHLPRTLQSKLFGIGPSGYFQLAVLCIAVGAIFEAGGINPFDPTFTWQTALTGLGTGALNVLGFVLQAGWKPMLTGAVVTLPIWLVWRLLSVPFRR